MERPPPENLAGILEQLATWANGGQTSTAVPTTARSASQPGVPNPSLQSILPQQELPDSTYQNNIYNNPLPMQISDFIGTGSSNINAPHSTVPTFPTPQSGPLGIEDHLQRLQQITDEARASRTDNVYAGSSVAFQTPLSDHTSSTPFESNLVLHWAPALRYVSRIGGPGSELERAVGKMIESQRTNEESWWKGHEKLKIEIERRNGDEKDLHVYDSKVYKAQLDMHNHMELQLRSLGVPFFGVPQKLIVETREEAQEEKITHQELRSLQLRMIEYLEDMYAP